MSRKDHDVTLHRNEIPVDEAMVRSLLGKQCPQWAHLPLYAAGSGTDNRLQAILIDAATR